MKTTEQTNYGLPRLNEAAPNFHAPTTAGISL